MNFKKYFLEKIFERLSEQLKEARNSWRKFTNWTVVSLKKIKENGDFVIEEIPYFAFGSTNVSLDAVLFKVNWETKKLREIMESIGLQNKETGEFLLPNSLWVSVMIVLKNGTIICQQRNNKATLTNYNWLTASASWAVNLDWEKWGPEILKANAVKEVSEELGIVSSFAPYFPQMEDIEGSIQEHILKELNLEKNSGIMVPTGVVMERKRHNPEVVFTLFLSEEYTMDVIRERWSNATDKWESIDLIWKTPQSIVDDINFYVNNLDEDMLKKATWLEDFIASCQDKNLTWPHLLMSYLAYWKAIWQTSEKVKWKINAIMEYK